MSTFRGEQIDKILADGAMDADSKIDELKKLLSEKCPKGHDMVEFAKESFDEYVTEALDNEDTRLNYGISGSLTGVSEKTKIIMNLWTDNNAGIENNEALLNMKLTMQEVVAEIKQ